MTRAERVVEAARGAVGSPFRLHGRDPVRGLDCVGLAAWALRGGGVLAEIPQGYALRSGDATRACRWMAAAGLVPGERPVPGDVLLLRPGPGQLHLAIVTDDGIVHADASARRVVERPGEVPWPLIGCWRLRERGEEYGDAGSDGGG
ncbi:peptidoglycan endopeptidase [Stakelama marina]|uniref:Peptidoglycan endopeptidase n=1 Tax=Stakelama marina TaxID=2826939 RepID=A0A8T4INJ9_9SPHN|nr:peptidoglycan endopeptidase [Stakelama marina]MBR0553899.1 peptidoglycan endopeptidase [Stakelama marina]